MGDDPGANPDISSSHDTDTGYRVFGGYLFHPNFGVVMSYVDLGTMNYSGPAWGGFTDELSADGFDLSFLAGFAPGQQKRFSLFGTIGIFGWKQDVHYVENIEDVPVPYGYEDSGVSLSYGVGGEVTFGAGAKWGFDFEYQRFMDVGDADNSGHEYDRDLISAGFHYRFGT